MKKIIFPLVFLFLLSCNTNKWDRQVRSDLIGMLQNKVAVKELNIIRTSEYKNGNTLMDSIYFNCSLFFKDDLYKDNGKLAFNKGMKLISKGNLFIYESVQNQIRLVNLRFTEENSATDYDDQILKN